MIQPKLWQRVKVQLQSGDIVTAKITDISVTPVVPVSALCSERWCKQSIRTKLFPKRSVHRIEGGIPNNFESAVREDRNGKTSIE
ncbi:MAG: hypothetical protein WA715_16925 [Candidatus Acidiferrum sp.]